MADRIAIDCVSAWFGRLAYPLSRRTMGIKHFHTDWPDTDSYWLIPTNDARL